MSIRKWSENTESIFPDLVTRKEQLWLGKHRDKAILEVLYSTGLRVSELTKLDRDKIDLERREFGIVGKGGRARVVFLSSRAAEWLKKYIAAREEKIKPLFIRHKGKTIKDISAEVGEKMRLTPRSVQRR